MTIGTETRHYTVARDGVDDICFTGLLLASGTDHENEGPQSDSWSEISIHKTMGGEYVVAQCLITRHQNEEDSHRGHVCESAQSVYDLLAGEDGDGDNGISSLAKKALEEAAKTDSAFASMRFEEA